MRATVFRTFPNASTIFCFAKYSSTSLTSILSGEITTSPTYRGDGSPNMSESASTVFGYDALNL